MDANRNNQALILNQPNRSWLQTIAAIATGEHMRQMQKLLLSGLLQQSRPRHRRSAPGAGRDNRTTSYYQRPRWGRQLNGGI